jgi:RNase P subunit RPR2
VATTQRLVCRNCQQLLERIDVLRVSPGSEVEFRVDLKCPKCRMDNVFDLFLRAPVRKALTAPQSAVERKASGN